MRIFEKGGNLSRTQNLTARSRIRHSQDRAHQKLSHTQNSEPAEELKLAAYYTKQGGHGSLVYTGQVHNSK